MNVRMLTVRRIGPTLARSETLNAVSDGRLREPTPIGIAIVELASIFGVQVSRFQGPFQRLASIIDVAR